MKKIVLVSLFVFGSLLANAQNFKTHPKKPYSPTDSCLVWQDSTKRFYRIKCSEINTGGSSAIDTTKVGRVEQGRGSVPASLSFDGVKWYMNDTAYAPLDDATTSFKNTWSAKNIYSHNYSTFFPLLITTENQSLSVQTIQGLNKLNALFLNQTNPLDNGFYGWDGASWTKFTFPFGKWQDEYSFLYNTIFISQEGTYAGQAFVFNNYIGDRSSRNISSSGEFDISQIIGGQSDTLADGKIWIGDGTDTAFPRTLSGDVTVSNLGEATVDSIKVGRIEQGRGTAPIFMYFNGVSWVRNDTSYAPKTALLAYIPVDGTDLMNGEFRTPYIGDYRGVLKMNYANSYLRQEYADGFYSFDFTSGGLSMTASYTTDDTRSRQFSVAENGKYTFSKDIAKYTGLTHAQIATKLNSEPFGLVTKQYLDSLSSGGGSVNASNGLSLAGDTVKLGGTLNDTTIINTNNNTLTLAALSTDANKVVLSVTSDGYSIFDVNNLGAFDLSLGFNAGISKTSGSGNIVMGRQAAENVASISSSNITGVTSCLTCTSVSESTVNGNIAGSYAVTESNLTGYGAGIMDNYGVSTSNLYGNGAGYSSKGMIGCNILGYYGAAGLSNAVSLRNSILIGNNTAQNDNVNTTTGGIIHIGNYTHTGGFNNTIAIGDSATNTKTNQVVFAPKYRHLRLRGVDYELPATQGGVDTYLKNNGSGVLTWATAGGVAPSTPNLEEVMIEGNSAGFHQIKDLAVGSDPDDAVNLQQLNDVYDYASDTLKVGRIEQGRGTAPIFMYFNGVAWVRNDTSYVSQTGTNKFSGDFLSNQSFFTFGLNSTNNNIIYSDQNYGRMISENSSSGIQSSVGAFSSSDGSIQLVVTNPTPAYSRQFVINGSSSATPNLAYMFDKGIAYYNGDYSAEMEASQNLIPSLKKVKQLISDSLSSGGGGSTTNPVTFNNSGSGDASGTTFNGSASRTISYNSVGAAPLASPTFTGTVTIPSGAVMNTPASIGLANGTGLPISTGVSGMGSGIATWLATPSSANLRTAITDETGTGVAVFGTSPTFTTDITAPVIIGGTGTTSSITYKATIGVGTTGADHIFMVGSGTTEAMRILNSGNVGIGTNAPVAQLHLSSDVTSSTRGLVIDQHSTDVASAPVFYRKSRGTLLSSTTVADQDYIGISAFAPYDGASYLQAAGFGARVNGTITTGSVPTDLFFYTGSANLTNPYVSGNVRMVINSSGNIGIGTTTPQSKLDVEGAVSIGATYSGTTAAPANGLLVEGLVGIGTSNPTVSLDVSSKTDAIRIANGTTAQRTTAASGLFRFNTTTSRFEGNDGTNWNTFTESIFPIMCSAPSSTYAASTTYYMGSAAFAGTLTSTANQRVMQIPFNATLIGASIGTRSGTPGSSETSTVYMRVNNTTDVQLTNTMSFASANTNQYTSALNTDVSAGDTYEVKLTTGAFTAAPATSFVTVMLYFKRR